MQPETNMVRVWWSSYAGMRLFVSLDVVKDGKPSDLACTQ